MHRLFLLMCWCAASAVRLPSPSIEIDYPENDSIFPPEVSAPTFLWHDDAATIWRIEVQYADGYAATTAQTIGQALAVGEIDPRCVAETNQPPRISPELARAHSWKPEPGMWEAMKQHSVDSPATLTITGFEKLNPDIVLSRGQVTFRTSKDPVGAPIFYRDVPLMPAELEKGVIKPLVPSAVPLISWRLRNVGESSSRLLMEGLPTCANCHSFSLDGKTLGMDVDGPQNDKGMYAITPVSAQMSIRSEDVFSWNSFGGRPPGQRTIGFMAQVSPDGNYAVTTLNEEMYVVNFKDYRFLQVFYPTRGIVAWRSRQTGEIRSLPGADNPSYVQTDAVWSPDGRYLIFARARAKDAYPEGRKLAKYANDPNEVQIRYDLYRIPFNSGKGGRPEPIEGASRNGMSNTFPKVSPDGRWIVFVRCRNGQLMRPDGRLFIVPFAGGQAREMRCNSRLMNSWHSFSPNGRWMVFSSKSRSPYTQMYLTHLDSDGNDSPAILIENTTAANRAVNIPEFVNVPRDGLSHIDVPAAEFYRLFDRAWTLAEKGQFDASIAAWEQALQISPDDAKAHNNLGRALAGKGDFELAAKHWEKALQINPEYPEAHNNLGVAATAKGKFDEAIAHFRKALETYPANAELHRNLANALSRRGAFREAMREWQKALEINPGYPEAYDDLGTAFFSRGKLDEAIVQWQRAIAAKPDFLQARYNIGRALLSRGKPDEAIRQWRAALEIDSEYIPALRHSAWVLATCSDASVRRGEEALRLAEKAARLPGGQQPEILDALAAALAEVGRFPEAEQVARRALLIATQENKLELAQALRSRISLYEGGKPFRQ